MAISQDFQKHLNSGNLAEALKLALTEMIELRICTRVVSEEGSDDRPGHQINTRINIVDGDIDNEVGSLFLKDGPYSELRSFHAQQVAEAQTIIRTNIESLQTLFSLLIPGLKNPSGQDQPVAQPLPMMDAGEPSTGSGGLGLGLGIVGGVAVGTAAVGAAAVGLSQSATTATTSAGVASAGITSTGTAQTTASGGTPVGFSGVETPEPSIAPLTLDHDTPEPATFGQTLDAAGTETEAEGGVEPLAGLVTDASSSLGSMAPSSGEPLAALTLPMSDGDQLFTPEAAPATAPIDSEAIDSAVEAAPVVSSGSMVSEEDQTILDFGAGTATIAGAATIASSITSATPSAGAIASLDDMDLGLTTSEADLDLAFSEDLDSSSAIDEDSDLSLSLMDEPDSTEEGVSDLSFGLMEDEPESEAEDSIDFGFTEDDISPPDLNFADAGLETPTVEESPLGEEDEFSLLDFEEPATIEGLDIPPGFADPLADLRLNTFAGHEEEGNLGDTLIFGKTIAETAASEEPAELPGLGDMDNPPASLSDALDSLDAFSDKEEGLEDHPLDLEDLGGEDLAGTESIHLDFGDMASEEDLHDPFDQPFDSALDAEEAKLDFGAEGFETSTPTEQSFTDSPFPGTTFDDEFNAEDDVSFIEQDTAIQPIPDPDEMMADLGLGAEAPQEPWDDLEPESPGDVLIEPSPNFSLEGTADLNLNTDLGLDLEAEEDLPDFMADVSGLETGADFPGDENQLDSWEDYSNTAALQELAELHPLEAPGDLDAEFESGFDSLEDPLGEMVDFTNASDLEGLGDLEAPSFEALSDDSSFDQAFAESDPFAEPSSDPQSFEEWEGLGTAGSIAAEGVPPLELSLEDHSPQSFEEFEGLMAEEPSADLGGGLDSLDAIEDLNLESGEWAVESTGNTGTDEDWGDMDDFEDMSLLDEELPAASLMIDKSEPRVGDAMGVADVDAMDSLFQNTDESFDFHAFESAADSELDPFLDLDDPFEDAQEPEADPFAVLEIDEEMQIPPPPPRPSRN